ncbi:MAG TPA: ABC transporter permease [Coxiellaceae bacterium]|nr:ABC transporter permease [Coxiellaceae bacterium]
MSQQADHFASVELTHQGAVLSLKGSWLIGDVSFADAWIEKLITTNSIIQLIDATQITQMDTAGAFLLFNIQKKLNNENIQVKIDGLNENFQSLLKVVTQKEAIVESKPIIIPHYNWFYRVGIATINVFNHTLSLFTFLGQIFVNILNLIQKPFRIQWRSVVHEIDVGGYRALPIIAVMMFLIGVVVAYQLGVQLRTYGANVYMVDLSGVAILREFSPLICSVIIAGRTSTSFAALLGTMKVNEEIDALQTMGMSPIERLVLPKIMGLLIALPLLVMWGNIFGLFGSMVIAKSMAGISFTAFLERFKAEVAIKHLYIGLVKTPVFALIIAGIGCYQGFQAEGSAQSVGERTTKAAVQAIFLIILADGLFSILFNWMDI